MPSNILLTGATGVLGAHVLKELLATTDANLFCVVRAESAEGAAQRLLSFLKVYDPELGLADAFFRRVTPLAGDVTDERFGLGEAAWQELAEKTDVTLHAAALTNLFLNYRRIAPINVGGTREAIRFALATRSRYLCYVSTHTVVGDKGFETGRVFRESDYDLGQGFHGLAYQQSKFEAEGLVRRAADDGLVWNILRPGQIFGEAETGRYPLGQANVAGLFYDILKTIIESGVAMAAPTHFDVVPVDYVSRAVVALGVRRPHSFATYHLTNPDVRSYTQFIETVRSLGFPVRIVAQPEYETLVSEGPFLVNGREYKSPTTSAFRWWFKRGIRFQTSGYTACDATRMLLGPQGIECPRIDRRLIATYIQAAAERGYLSAPAFRSDSGRKPAMAEGEAREVSA